MTSPNTDKEDITLRRRRIRYRAWHRGTREMDMVLGHFADAKLETLDDAQLDRLEKLMSEQDTDLLKWVMGQEVPPAAVDVDLLKELTDFQTERLKQK